MTSSWKGRVTSVNSSHQWLRTEFIPNVGRWQAITRTKDDPGLNFSEGPIGTINNAYYLCWWNYEPPICPPNRVQNPSTNNAILRKITILKSELAERLYDDNVWHIGITKPTVIQHFMPFISPILSIMTKYYLLFYKLICTRTWGQTSGSRVDHQR